MGDTRVIHHKNLAGGPSVKGVYCKRCGEYVGLVEGKSGRWYTCQLRQSMSETRISYVAAPWQPHAKVCGQSQRETERADAARTKREATLRQAITKMESLLPDPAAEEDIALWRKCLVDEGFEA